MLDVNLIIENPEYVKMALAKKNCHVDFHDLLQQIEERRELVGVCESLRAKRNVLVKEVQQYDGDKKQAIIEEMQQIKSDLAGKEPRLKTLIAEIDSFVGELPNIPMDYVVGGGKENNKIVKVHEEKPQFSFTPKDHVELAESLQIIDYKRGAKISGNGFWVYTGKGAILEWALLNYFIAQHIKDGYTFLLPPHMLNYDSGFAAGQFPKFEDDVFVLSQTNKNYKQFMLPTAETALVNFHRDEILPEHDLPAKYFAYTPCYRKEAGSYRAEERGMIRGHQFNKVELFQFTRPEESGKALQELLGKAEQLVEGLGLHYQTVQLAAEDCSAAMRETYDVEVWIPSMNGYKEVTSSSNAGDYQARRGKIRYKREVDGKNCFVHTLNASGLATSRILPAMLEQHQREDGSIVIPEVLQPFTGFAEIGVKD